MQEEFCYEQLKMAMSKSYPGIKYQPFLQANYVRLSPNECDGLINDATKILKEQMLIEIVNATKWGSRFI